MEQDKSTYIKSKIDELLGLTIDDTRADQLADFYEMIIEKNKVMNLIWAVRLLLMSGPERDFRVCH